MNKIVLVVIAGLSLSGCANMTPGEKVVTGVIVGALVIGAINASKSDSVTVDECNDYISFPNPNSPVSYAGCP
jgi:hypothetical protein